eukprot:scaffold27679_cov21-Tisochrysis_lutea.AAC.3
MCFWSQALRNAGALAHGLLCICTAVTAVRHQVDALTCCIKLEVGVGPGAVIGHIQKRHKSKDVVGDPAGAGCRGGHRCLKVHTAVLPSLSAQAPAQSLQDLQQLPLGSTSLQAREKSSVVTELNAAELADCNRVPAPLKSNHHATYILEGTRAHAGKCPLKPAAVSHAFSVHELREQASETLLGAIAWGLHISSACACTPTELRGYKSITSTTTQSRICLYQVARVNVNAHVNDLSQRMMAVEHTCSGHPMLGAKVVLLVGRSNAPVACKA